MSWKVNDTEHERIRQRFVRERVYDHLRILRSYLTEVFDSIANGDNWKHDDDLNTMFDFLNSLNKTHKDRQMRELYDPAYCTKPDVPRKGGMHCTRRSGVRNRG